MTYKNSPPSAIQAENGLKTLIDKQQSRTTFQTLGRAEVGVFKHISRV